MKLRNTSLLLGMAALAACSDQATEPASARNAPVHFAANGRGIEGSYIVVLNEGADARAVAAVAGVSPQHVYSAALNGFSASLNAGQLNALRSHPSVDYVEQDQVVLPTATQSSATWGIDRSDQRSLPLSGTYNYTATA